MQDAAADYEAVSYSLVTAYIPNISVTAASRYFGRAAPMNRADLLPAQSHGLRRPEPPSTTHRNFDRLCLSRAAGEAGRAMTS